MKTAKALANLIKGTVYEFSNGKLAAAGSTIAKEFFDSGLVVTTVAHPDRTQEPDNQELDELVRLRLV